MSEGTTPPSGHRSDDDDHTVAFTADAGLPEPLPAPPPPPPGPGPGEQPTEAGTFDGAATGGPVTDQRPTPWKTRPAGAAATPPPTVRAPAPPPGSDGPPGRTPPPPSPKPGGGSNALTFVAVGGVIVLVVVIVVMALVLGFGGDDDGDEVATSDSTTSTTTTTSTSTTEATTTSTEATTTSAPAPSTTVAPPAVTIIIDGRDLEPGLLCRDLMAQGATFDEALAYWLQEGRPARMDDDGNGIPCETVYPPADVEAVYGPQGLEEEGVQTGLFCRDLPPLGLDYSAAFAYWETEGRPARMDDDGNGIPCETVYPPAEVQAFFG